MIARCICRSCVGTSIIGVVTSMSSPAVTDERTFSGNQLNFYVGWLIYACVLDMYLVIIKSDHVHKTSILVN